jgi:hypothetical protein
MQRLSNASVIKSIFFGNYFYGLCVVFLSIETLVQLKLPVQECSFFVLIFLVTVVYYTKAYTSYTGFDKANLRTVWYHQHKKAINNSQILYSVVGLILCITIAFQYHTALLNISIKSIVIVIIFPLIALLYYGLDHHFFSKKNLRSIGWLKPFTIGFVWSGMVTTYPVLYHHTANQIDLQITLELVLLFIKNFIFITVLAIMFDIKDYAADNNQQLKTFVVRIGLRKTIFAIIIPLTIVGFTISILYEWQQQFSTFRMILNSLIFPLILLVAYTLHNRKSILFYLIVIDGLMLVKAICGICGIMLG